MPNSIDFYKRIFLHVIPVRILVSCSYLLLFLNEDFLVTNFQVYVDWLYIGTKSWFSNQNYFFFILNFWAALNKGKGLYMDRNEVFGRWNFILLLFCIYCHLLLAFFYTAPFGTCTSLCITLHFVLVYTFAFAS